MNSRVGASPHSSLCALRGAVGEVVGGGAVVRCWDRMVWLWRIFLALDGLIAMLWGMVDRLRAGDLVLDEPLVFAGSRPRRRRSRLRPSRLPSVRRRAAVVAARVVAGPRSWFGWERGMRARRGSLRCWRFGPCDVQKLKLLPLEITF